MSSIINDNNIIQSPFNKASKDKFLLVMTYPPVLRGIIEKFNYSNKTLIPKSLEFAVYGAVVPPVSIPSITIPYAGQSLKVSSHAREPYEKLALKFVIDNRFKNYWVIHKWLTILNDEKNSGFDFNNLSNRNPTNNAEIEKQYMADLSIYGLDEYNKRTIEFKYTKAFPTLLGGIEYSHQDATEIESSVEFAYSQYFPVLNEQVEQL